LACTGILAGALALAGCSAKSATTEPLAKKQEPTVTVGATSTAKGVQDAKILGAALQGVLLEDRSFSDEPKGEIEPDGVERDFVYISKVTTSPAALTFDIVQYYQGESAAKEAAKDGKTAPDNDVYTRNAYPHTQTIKIADGAGAVGQFGRPGDTIYGSEDAAQITPLTFEQFAAWYAEQDKTRRATTGYWLELDYDGVLSIVKQYEP
jgi:hypothetical protein